jgi:hypothetical protein
LIDHKKYASRCKKQNQHNLFTLAGTFIKWLSYSCCFLAPVFFKEKNSTRTSSVPGSFLTLAQLYLRRQFAREGWFGRSRTGRLVRSLARGLGGVQNNYSAPRESNSATLRNSVRPPGCRITYSAPESIELNRTSKLVAA